MIETSDAKTHIYFEKISFLISRLDDFWRFRCYCNDKSSGDLIVQYNDWQKNRDRKLPDAITSLKGKLTSLEILVKEVSRWDKPLAVPYPYIPDPNLIPLFQLIKYVNAKDHKKAEEELQKFNDEIESFLYLQSVDWMNEKDKQEKKSGQLEQDLQLYAKSFLRFGSDKDIEDFIDLFPKLAANQKNLMELIKSPRQQASFHAAFKYVERGCLFKDRNPQKYYRQILNCFTYAIHLNSSPNSTTFALHKRAELYLQRGDLTAAIEDLAGAYQIAKDQVTCVEYAAALRRRAEYYLEKAEVTAGLSDLAKACQVVEDPIVFEEYATALIANQKYLEAIGWLKRALLLTPKNVSIHALLQKALDEGEPPFDLFQEIQSLVAVCQGLAELSSTSSSGPQLPLWLEASKQGDLRLMMYLAPQVNVAVQDTEGNMIFHYVARLGYLHLLDFLFTLKLNINGLNKARQSPLLVAAQHGKVAMVNGLLLRDLEFGNEDYNVLKTTIFYGQGCVLESLFSYSKYEALVKINGGVDVLFRQAIDARRLSILLLLIQRYPEALYSTECFPLHYAVEKEYQPGVQLLIESGADVEQENSQQKTPLQLAKDATGEGAATLQAYVEGEVQKNKRIKENIKSNFSKLLTAISSEFRSITARELKNILYDVLLKLPNTLHWLRQDACRIEPLSQQIIEKLNGSIALGLFEIRDKIPAIISEVLLNFNYSSSTVVRSTEERKVSLETKAAEELAAVQHPNLMAFREYFEKQLDVAYSYFSVVASGELVTIQDQNAIALASRVPSMTLQGVRIPNNTVDSLNLAIYIRQTYRKKEAERMVAVFKTNTPFQRMHFMQYLAWQLADRYQLQIKQLEPNKGVEHFADCMAAKLIEYIVRARESEPQMAEVLKQVKELIPIVQMWTIGQVIPFDQQQQRVSYENFLDSLVMRSSSFPREEDQLQTVGTPARNWSVKGTLGRTGIITSADSSWNIQGAFLVRVLASLRASEDLNISSPTRSSSVAAPMLTAFDKLKSSAVTEAGPTSAAVTVPMLRHGSKAKSPVAS